MKTKIGINGFGMDTLVIGGDVAKVVAWYDNEGGYSMRVADLAWYVVERERR